jgi:hypothetical protein
MFSGSGCGNSGGGNCHASSRQSSASDPRSLAGLERLGGKRVTLLEAAALQAAFEPMHALGRAAVGECVRHDCAVRLALQAIITHRAGRVQRRLDIALLDDVLGTVPSPSSAIG